MPLWLNVVLLVLATHRVTRVVTRDKIPLVDVPRESFVNRWGAPSAAAPDARNTSFSGRKTNAFMRSLAYLWECDWCASVWVAAAITYAAWLWTPLGDHHWFIAVLAGLSASTCTGLIAQREPD